MAKPKKPGTDNAWESGELGENMESAKVVSSETERAIQDALGMQLISIRLPKSVIEDFKVIAQIEGIGYQPLMREALIRYAECESKRIMREYASKVASDKAQIAADEGKAKPSRKHAATRNLDEPDRKVA
ncbi:hypothetical protein [Simplicispira piscis]